MSSFNYILVVALAMLLAFILGLTIAAEGAEKPKWHDCTFVSKDKYETMAECEMGDFVYMVYYNQNRSQSKGGHYMRMKRIYPTSETVSCVEGELSSVNYIRID